MKTFPFLDADPAHTGFQYLEDLATAYWYSEVLFAALRLRLFDYLSRDWKDLETLAHESSCDRDALGRLLRVLSKLELVGEADGRWHNSQAAGKYLVSANASYMGNFLLYRHYMKPGWDGLCGRLSGKSAGDVEAAAQDDYALRNLRYVKAMDALAREKAEEIAGIIPMENRHSPVLDIGGGAGALCRALIRSNPGSTACLFDLAEVIQAAREIYPRPEAWHGIETIEGDFRTFEFSSGQKYGLVLMANFLHAYGPQEAKRLLEKARSLLAPDGLLVVHDYFPDCGRRSPHKGALYDLNMLLNTYDGVCHTAEEITGWLKESGIINICQRDLSSDSSLIMAAGPQAGFAMQPMDEWPRIARALGFRNAVELPTSKVVTGEWVRLKCRHGCPLYGKKLQCPPHCITLEETRQLLKSYTRVLLVEDAPPGKTFHKKLLSLERKAFLVGYHKAFAFGAGPCTVCDSCPDDGICRKPQKSRPSMEGAGMDVYATARNAGLSIEPVQTKGDYVKYFGLLLLE